MTELRLAILGTGFWSGYQLAGCLELTGGRCVALYNPPCLKQLDPFSLTDIGSPIPDTARFRFGDAARRCCPNSRVHPDIRSEHVASVRMTMAGGATVVCNTSCASRVAQDRFPETCVLIEGDQGALESSPDYWLRLTTATGTQARRCPPPFHHHSA